MQIAVNQHKSIGFENRWSAIGYLFSSGNRQANDLVTEILCKSASV